MPSIQNLISARSVIGARSEEGAMPDNLLDYMIALLALLFFSLLLAALLVVLRRRRLQRSNGMYTYDGKNSRNHNNLTIETTQNGRASIFVINRNGQPMLTNPNSPPSSPDNVPEIRITFPDEHDEAGQKKSGRVLVVRVGDGGVVGLEPVREEQLPAYERDTKTDFYSIDMDQIGGLREKEYR